MSSALSSNIDSRRASEGISPSQLKIDRLAVFIETAEELQREPFFDLHENPRYTIQGDKLTVMEFGDVFHFRSALIPFRRLWREGEDSYFRDILRIVARYDPTATAAVQWYDDAHSQLEEKPCFPPRVTLSSREVIDGWLYSVFVHTNLTRSTRRPRSYDRRDFQANVKKFGHAWYEYAFREAVKQAGWIYFNILAQLARPLAVRWDAAGYRPSFEKLAAFGASKRETAPDGSVIIRQSSTLYGVDETLLQKFFRLLKRFRSLEGICESLKMTKEEALKAVVESRSIRELIAAAGFELHLVEHYRLDDTAPTMKGSVFDIVTKTQGSYCATADRVFIASKAVLRAWQREFSELKSLLADKEPKMHTQLADYPVKGWK